MLGPPKTRDPDRPVLSSLEALVPQDHFYRHLETTLDLSCVRDWVADCYAERGRPHPRSHFPVQPTPGMLIISFLRWLIGYSAPARRFRRDRPFSTGWSAVQRHIPDGVVPFDARRKGTSCGRRIRRQTCNVSRLKTGDTVSMPCMLGSPTVFAVLKCGSGRSATWWDCLGR